MGQEYKRSTDVFHLQPDFGDILLYDDFEAPILNWGEAGTPTPLVELKTDYAFHGSQSLLVCTDELTPGTNDYALAGRALSVPPSGIIELFARVRLQYSNKGIILISLERYLGAESFQGSIGYDGPNKSIVYLDADGNLTSIHTFPDYLDASYWTWHTFRLAINFITNKYISAQVAHEPVDISGISIDQPDNPDADMFQLFLHVIATEDTQISARFDTVMLKTYTGD